MAACNRVACVFNGTKASKTRIHARSHGWSIRPVNAAVPINHHAAKKKGNDLGEEQPDQPPDGSTEMELLQE